MVQCCWCATRRLAGHPRDQCHTWAHCWPLLLADLAPCGSCQVHNLHVCHYDDVVHGPIRQCQEKLGQECRAISKPGPGLLLSQPPQGTLHEPIGSRVGTEGTVAGVETIGIWATSSCTLLALLEHAWAQTCIIYITSI